MANSRGLGTVVWFTGLPASGKSTLAAAVRERLGSAAVLLDSDRLREVFGATGYGRDDRDGFYAVLGRLATMLAEQGHVVLIAATAARRAYRDAVRATVPRFLEVHVATARALCEARDRKGLYERAKAGQAPDLPGVGKDYEPPQHPDVVANGGHDHVAATTILALLASRSRCDRGVDDLRWLQMSDLAVHSVLVVDDNADNRALAQATLEDEGIGVTLATNAAEAIAAFTTKRPDCILLDIRMPGTDGIAACEAIRKLPGGDAVAIVFVTAQRDVDTFDRAARAGGDDFMTKPFRPTELVVRIQTALRLRRMAAERNELVAQFKVQRDELQRLQLHKEQLTSFLVHDLKNPVHAIELHAQRILRGVADERARDSAARIHDETGALMRMITNLLDIGKADEGQLAPVPTAIDPQMLVAAAVDDLRTRAASAEIELVTAIDASPFRADPNLMHRVLVNLLDNAIRHAPEHTVVQVRVDRDRGGTRFRVIDAGPGVPAERRDRVFDRYNTAETTERGNRGLGLTFCKVAVEAHHGRIWIEDAAPGAVFCIWLPDAA